MNDTTYPSRSPVRAMLRDERLRDERIQRRIKRLIDISAALFGMIALSIPFGIISLVIKLTSPGPVFYVSSRIGRHGVPFRLYKFRSMRPAPEGTGPAVTRKDDDRITRIGAILRKTKVDELPQLINILKGEMSLVGPRPEAPVYVDAYSAEQRQVLDVAPGFTSLASIRYRNEESMLSGPDWERLYLDEIMPDKLKVDLRYLDHWSLGLDLRILIYTIVVLPSMDDTDLL